MDIEALRAATPAYSACTYLNHAAVGPVSVEVAEASGEPARLQTQDPVVMNQTLAERAAAARGSAGRVFGVAPERVAFVGNTSHGLGLIANGLDWREGDNIVVSSHEFPSNFLIWKTFEEKGATLRDFPLRDGRLTATAVAEVIDDRTRVVALSHVQYHNGFRADIGALAEVAHAHGALLVVDGTQSGGAMVFDLDGWGADALVVSCHKWMLCPKGIGIMALSARALREVGVAVPGWQSVNDRFEFRRQLDFVPSAARFESGTENAPGIFALAARLGEIEALGPEAIATRILMLRDRLEAGLQAGGWQITSPGGDAERSGILTTRHETKTTEDALDRLIAAGIRASARGGALRLSPHVANTEAEIDRALGVLA